MMSALAWLATAALVAAPVPTGSPADSERVALALYDEGAFLEAADAAATGYVSPGPGATRLRNARLAQEALSRLYQNTARPEYLCRALDVREATWALAVEDEDREIHRALTTTHQATLAARHPGHTCEVGTELRPILDSGRTPMQPPSILEGPPLADVPEAKNTDTTQEIRALLALKTGGFGVTAPAAINISGAVAITLGVAALATMTGGLVIRAQANRAAIPLADAKAQQHGLFTIEQGREFAGLTATTNAGRQMALAGGISGAVLLTLGATLVGWSYTSAARARVSPMAGFGRAGLFMEGRF